MRLNRGLSRFLRAHVVALTVLAGVTSATITAAVVSVTLWSERSDQLQHAREQAGNLALIAERDISRSLELYHLSLRAIAEGWEQPSLRALPAALRNRILFDRSLDSPYITSAVVLGPDGRIVANLKNAGTVGLDLSDREYFKGHAASADEGLHISQPFLSRITDATAIALSRRVFMEDGSFGGVAVVYLNMSYFRELMEGLELGPGGRTTIFERGGTVLTSMPPGGEPLGLDGSSSELYRTVMGARSGSFVSNAYLDQIQRLNVFTTTQVGGMKVVVAPAIRDIYAPWLRKALVLGAITAALCVGIVLVSLLLGMALRSRLRAEDRLLLLADTDALTGLLNRRALDRVLAAEAVLPAAEGRTVALLFIDVDHFKPYNDSQGHPAGDVVLKAIAFCLSKRVVGPLDHVARYGGEEFVVVLIDTSTQAAARTAETLRAAVEAMGIPHPRSPGGVVTVSIGLATTTSSALTQPSQVLEAADVALYEAKEAGRNQVRVSGAATPLPGAAASVGAREETATRPYARGASRLMPLDQD
ncbi:MAG: GGDEF domain-containing protein [Comamonadaceae bacterium]|nr:MAG: GGDEF domain-containing protein [Comamonadaceae bacterium]